MLSTSKRAGATPGAAFIKALGDKHAVVLDIGAAYTKSLSPPLFHPMETKGVDRAGFAAAFAPHAIIPSRVEGDWRGGESAAVVDFGRPAKEQRAIFKCFLYTVYYE